MAFGQQMASFPEGLRSGIINNATAILMGHLLVRDATNNNLVVRCAASNSAQVGGVAMYDGGAQNTEVGYATGGDVWVRNTSGAAIAAGDSLVSHASGGVMKAASTDKNVVGKANFAAADGDLFSAHIELVTLPS